MGDRFRSLLGVFHSFFESIFGVHYLLSSLVADYFSQRNVSLDCAREVDLNDKYSS